MEHMSLSETWEYLISLGAPVWGGVFTAISVFAIIVILSSKRIIFAGQEKKIEQAKKAGHVVTGIRTYCRKQESSSDTKVTNRTYVAIYKYNINGYEGEKQVIADSFEPPKSIPLYYIDSPKKVISEYDKSGSGCLMIFVCYIIPILAACAVMKLMGYNFEN